MAVTTKKGSDLLPFVQGMLGGYDVTADIYDGLTMAAHELSAYDLSELRTTIEHTPAKGQNVLDLQQDDANAPPIMAVLWVRDETSNRRLRRRDAILFADEDKANQGPPSRWARDGMQLYLSPPLDGSYKLRVRVKLRHPDVNAGQEILFPRDWHRLLCYRAAEFVADIMVNPERSVYFGAKADKLLAERLAALPQVQEDQEDIDASVGYRAED